MNLIKALSKINKKTISIAAIVAAVVFVVVCAHKATAIFGRDILNVEKSLGFNMFMAVPFICFAVVTAYFIYFLVSKKKFKYEKLYVITALMFGLAMEVIMPPLSGPDENTHFLSAYHAADAVLLTDFYGEEGPFYQRAEEMKYPDYYMAFPDVYEMLADGNWFGTNPGRKHLFLVNEITVSHNRYPLSAVGIAIARILDFGVVGLMYAGRLMNMFGMILFGYYAVKLTPYGKAQIVAFSMIPLILELCNSYSYDGMSIMMTILFTVLCLRYSDEDRPLTWLGLYGLVSVYALLVPQKTVYMFFAPMVLMIPLKKVKAFLFPDKTRSTIIKFVTFAFYSLFILALDFRKYLGIAFGILGKSNGEAIEQVSDRPSFTLSYMLHNPKHVFAISWSTIRLYGWTDIKNMFGASLGSHKLPVPVPNYLIVLLIISVVAGLFVSRGKWIGKKRFIISLVGIIIVLGAIVLGCLLRFTPIEGTDRIQIAGRYYLPVFLSTFILLGTNKKENKAALAVLAVECGLLMLIMCSVLNYLMAYVPG